MIWAAPAGAGASSPQISGKKVAFIIIHRLCQRMKAGGKPWKGGLFTASAKGQESTLNGAHLNVRFPAAGQCLHLARFSLCAAGLP